MSFNLKEIIFCFRNVDNGSQRIIFIQFEFKISFQKYIIQIYFILRNKSIYLYLIVLFFQIFHMHVKKIRFLYLHQSTWSIDLRHQLFNTSPIQLVC